MRRGAGREKSATRTSEQSAWAAEDELEGRFELRKELVGALDSLSPSCRETILLRYFEGLAPRDIATRQRAPVATVKKRLRRGLAQLREALDKRHGGDRATWMSAVTSLAVPVDQRCWDRHSCDRRDGHGNDDQGVRREFSWRRPVCTSWYEYRRAEPPRMATVEPLATDVELLDPIDAGFVSAVEGPATVTEAGRRSLAA